MISPPKIFQLVTPLFARAVVQVVSVAKSTGSSARCSATMLSSIPSPTSVPRSRSSPSSSSGKSRTPLLAFEVTFHTHYPVQHSQHGVDPDDVRACSMLPPLNIMSDPRPLSYSLAFSHRPSARSPTKREASSSISSSSLSVVLPCSSPSSRPTLTRYILLWFTNSLHKAPSSFSALCVVRPPGSL